VDNADQRNEQNGPYLSDRLTREILHDLYNVQNKSLQDIASAFNCTRQNIYHLMRKYAIDRRPRSEARVLAIKQGKFGDTFYYDDIDELFFSEWSPGMAWVLGVIYTDGCLIRGKTAWRVDISSMDAELLNKIKHLMRSDKPLPTRLQSYDKSKEIYYFQFHREKLIDDLVKIGLVERKSLVMKFPDVPDNHVRHFIRGCWDGDGSVYIDKNGLLRVNYISGSYDFINLLVMRLYQIGITQRRLSVHLTFAERSKLLDEYPIGSYPLTIHKTANSNAYYITFQRDDRLRLFYDYLYRDVDDSLFLARKKAVFEKGFSSLSTGSVE
jgi:hypothetical protein